MDRKDGATISVLIPVFNEAETIGALLERLLDLDIAQIIVCDGGSTDKTREIIGTYEEVELVVGKSGRGNQINRAAKAAHSDILWILHADSKIPSNAVAQIRACLIDPAVSMGCFRVKFDQRYPILSLYGYCSRFETRFTTFGDQGFFMTRAGFVQIGNSPPWCLFEDVAIRRALARQGRIIKLDSVIATSARRFTRYGVIWGQLLNLYLLVRFLTGANPDRLAEIYYSRPKQAASDQSHLDKRTPFPRRTYLG